MAHDQVWSDVYSLPLQVATPVDVGRLIREVEALDNILIAYDVKGTVDEAKMPKTTLLLDAIIDANKMNLLDADQRAKLLQFLQTARAHAPVIHVSFGSDPAPAFIEKLMTWLRREIHPQLLITVGLQPNVGAGCLVRTTNHYFDFSLRESFKNNRELLMAKLREVEAE